eukprot:768253-Hanusia_phi.AAC.6
MRSRIHGVGVIGWVAGGHMEEKKAEHYHPILCPISLPLLPTSPDPYSMRPQCHPSTSAEPRLGGNLTADGLPATCP